MGHRATVLLIAAAVAVGTGCSSTQKAIDRAFAPPPVDLRAVPGGVEVGLVCGPGVPLFSVLQKIGNNGQDIETVATVNYPKSHATRTVLLAVPMTARSVRLAGGITLDDLAPPGVPFNSYVFEFRYSDLPRTKAQRIGGDCHRQQP